ncbi:DeoR/GlpR family DNA-binding transcription regulator [Chitinilyticum piscinae]|uniref:DeoR/GlpR transcriptional regulator n=1 Tax=Chitinilyticum piscinae TaxID=2866724 RepID=A0A8J7FQA5_9NEIS|nr:DeoR/GlpR family DNA-binding transcription regulator [Chitinilyticum piscinae]MBE9608706.1 DeoR/GlpR transcriptional regulator [Chitinilyticum piscinae]
MILNPRQQELLEWVQRAGHATVDELAQHFGVTPQTIRRDINQLADERKLQRVHGGASAHSSVENVAYSTRQVLCSNEKEGIARLVAEHIPNHASVFMNLGTTSEAVARALAHHTGLRIITNNTHIAMTMCHYRDCEVILAGGVMRPKDHGIVGEATIEFIRQFKVDYAVLGVACIEADGTLRDFEMREVKTSTAIMAQARHVFLVADHSKFGRPSLVEMGHLRQITALFTDRHPGEAMATVLNDCNTELYVASDALPNDGD